MPRLRKKHTNIEIYNAKKRLGMFSSSKANGQTTKPSFSQDHTKSEVPGKCEHMDEASCPLYTIEEKEEFNILVKIEPTDFDATEEPTPSFSPVAIKKECPDDDELPLIMKAEVEDSVISIAPVDRTSHNIAIIEQKLRQFPHQQADEIAKELIMILDNRLYSNNIPLE